MADYRLNGLLWSLSLLASGLLMLLFTLDVLGAEWPAGRYGLALVLLVGGAGFFAAFFASHHHWWRLIPAWALLALAGMVYGSTLSLISAAMTGGLLLVGLALAFAHVYLLNRREHWWAILPGGFLLVLGVVIAVSDRLSITLLGGLLFIGTGGVFSLLYVLGDRRRQWWALVPAAILGIFGLFVLASGAPDTLMARWWPLLLIALGLALAWQTAHRSPPEKLTIHTAPALPKTAPPESGRGVLGEYSQPAPGTSIEILSEGDN
jgi:drug/metabolite transporter (DMT)-like permease